MNIPTFVNPRGKVATEFRQTFSRTLREFWSPITGFDIIAFDDSIEHSLPGYVDGVSLQDAIRAEYGEPAVTLIKRLITGDNLD
jgi:hypothetical protein